MTAASLDIKDGIHVALNLPYLWALLQAGVLNLSPLGAGCRGQSLSFHSRRNPRHHEAKLPWTHGEQCGPQMRRGLPGQTVRQRKDAARVPRPGGAAVSGSVEVFRWTANVRVPHGGRWRSGGPAHLAWPSAP